ncbi:hypothetical protein Glove_103g57 [Diversispora epigaea]|uniref:F-box domain-containing protein n=1 Tax=Diversispora epigaea TaxID=1348612 RepID=A0A397J3H0_9GLOM|nr:hypothetical protein Glove_103g57 [Diversispora epigaea]
MNNFDFFEVKFGNYSIPGFNNNSTKPPKPQLQQKKQLQKITLKPKSLSSQSPSSTLKSTLSPDLLFKILRNLPITSIPNFARACRRFKVLVYDDELWEQHLNTLGIRIKDDSKIDLMSKSLEDIFMDSEKQYFENKAKRMSESHDNAIITSNRDRSRDRGRDRGRDRDRDRDNRESYANKKDNRERVNSESRENIESYTNYYSNEKLLGSQETLKTLSMIPGLPLDPFLSQKSWKASTGIARATFKRIYIELIPYYFDFRNRRKDSRLFKEYIDPAQQAKMLKRLAKFGKLNISLDSDQINNALVTTIEYFENSSLHNFELAYDANNTIEMKKWANILIYLNGGASCIQVFIQKNRIFFDYTFDALDNFTSITSSSYSYSYGGELTFKPMSEFFNHIEEELVKQASLITQVFPPEADVLYSFTERVIEDMITEYICTLLEEAHNLDVFIYLKTTTIAHLNCIHVAEVLWKHAKPGLDKIRAEDMLYLMFEPLMDQYLSEEFITVKTLSEEEVDKWNRKLVDKTTLEQQSFLNNSNREVYKRNYLSSFRKILKLSTPRSLSISNNLPSDKDKRNSVTSFQSTTTSPTTSFSSSFHRKNNSSVDTQISVSSWNAKSDRLQQLLSLETALQMIHINKDSIRRIGIFVGYPDKMGYKIIETIENVFILLLRTLGTKHIKPGFDTAIQHLGDHKSDSETSSRSLTPFVEFFELVHIADLIQQMLQVYYDEEMNRFIDKTDFMNICNKEKKAFEKILDESVASGLNKGIQVLIDHVEYILATVQKPEDFRPPIDVPLDLKPTKACVEAVECLSTHVKLVVDCSDKQTLDVFFQEIGLRLFGVLSKHLKKFIVSTPGGFQIISDLNHYCSFITTLWQPAITPHFIALKELGNIYIISSARDIGLFVRESDRFNGIFYAEDVYEFCQKREDWMTIKKSVEKELYGLKAEDCVIM